MLLAKRLGKELSASESVVLDGARTLAALMVFAAHCQMELYGTPTRLGHFGVLIFFVISGYVIAAVSRTKESTATLYFVSRLARLFSVVLPVLALVLVLHVCAWLVDPEFANSQFRLPGAFRGAAISLVFANQWWLIDTWPFNDVPYWSLSYEAAYYAIWGALLFAPNRRWLWVGSIAVAVGPKILLLFPLWLAGAALYNIRLQLTRLGAATAIALAAVLVWFAPERSHFSRLTLEFSVDFLQDYSYGAAIGLVFWAILSISRMRRERGIAWIANRSFTLYLLHLPLLTYASAWLGPMAGAASGGRVVLSMFALMVCLTVGSVIEPQKTWWRKQFMSLLRSANALGTKTKAPNPAG